MRGLRTIRAIVMIALMAVPCFGGEVAVLKNGFSIRHERREVVGDVTRLYVKADGSSFVDVPTAEIEHFEVADDPAVGSRLAATATKSVFPAVAGASAIHSKVDITEVVNEASGRYRLDPDLVNSVIKAESAFQVRAVSPKGAQGLMQLMPGTASQLGVPNAFDAQANVEGGTKYLRELLERYNFDLVKALAAYNAGPHRVEQFGGVPPYYETRAYVARIVRDFNKKKAAQDKAVAASKKRTPAKNASANSSVPTSKHASKSTVQAKASTPGQ
jgi:hypothetical protein